MFQLLFPRATIPAYLHKGSLLGLYIRTLSKVFSCCSSSELINVEGLLEDALIWSHETGYSPCHWAGEKRLDGFKMNLNST